MTMKKYKHLDLVQRSQIFALKAKKIKQKDIALILGCSPSTVSNELKRNASKKGGYFPKLAQETADERKKRFTNKRKFTDQMKTLVIKLITENQ